MKYLLNYILLFLSLLLGASCHPERVNLQAQLPGSYVGSTPCSHCRGVYSKVIFLEDGTARMTTERDDKEALLGRAGKWVMQDSIVQIDMGRDTLYFRWVSSLQLMSLYKDCTHSSEMTEGYSLYKDTIK